MERTFRLSRGVAWIVLLIWAGLLIIQLIVGKLNFLPRVLLLVPAGITILTTVGLSILGSILARRE